MKNSVIIKGNKYGITVILDKDLPFEELKEAVAAKFRESTKFFGDAQMAASFEGRKLSEKEEREILDVIAENSDFRIICILDTDQEKEEMFKKSLNARLRELSAQSGQFYKGTLRSGQVLEAEYCGAWGCQSRCQGNIKGECHSSRRIEGNCVCWGSRSRDLFCGST